MLGSRTIFAEFSLKNSFKTLGVSDIVQRLKRLQELNKKIYMLMSLTLYCNQIKQGFFSFCHSSLGVIIRFKKCIFSDQQRNQLRFPRLFKFGCQCKGVMLCVVRICRCAVSKVFILVPVLQAFFCLSFFPWQNDCFTFISFL